MVGGSKGRKVPVLFIVGALECLDEIHLDLEGLSSPIRDAHSLSSPVPRVPKQIDIQKKPMNSMHSSLGSHRGGE